MIRLRPRHGATALILAFTLTAGVLPEAPASAIGVGARKPPAEWDARLAELVDFVERERGLDFKHPVRVRFLTERQFRKAVATGQGELSRQDRAGLERQAGLLRALGLLEGNASVLRDGTGAVQVAELAAFYKWDKEEVVIRGKRLDTSARVAVVHELTHALQDQHFDLSKLVETTGRGAVVALIEGDAMRIEGEYLSTLSPSEQDAYAKTSASRAAAAEGAIPPDVPAVLQILNEAPYSLGPAFVEAIITERGEEGIDAAFRTPPTNDKQILNPAAYLRGADPTPVAAPRLTPGETRLGPDDTLGALGLYLTLAARVDPGIALSTVDAWDGDALVQFTRGGTMCARATVAGTDATGVEKIAMALGQWMALGPRETDSVQRANDAVTFTACDSDQPPTQGNVVDAGDVLDARASVLAGEIQRGIPLEAALCVADRAAYGPDARALVVEKQPTREETDVFMSMIKGVEAACGV
jgi:hypothetical protein